MFYAWSDDQGRAFSKPVSIGDVNKLPGRPDVMALGSKVAIVWEEFDGKITTVSTMDSSDGGQRWSMSKKIADRPHPVLLTDGNRLFLSCNSTDKGFQLIRVD